MSTASAVVDTSIFIAAENGRPMDLSGVPGDSVVSVVTVAELHAGVLAAVDVDVRARRLATLQSTNDIEMLGIDEQVALMWATMRVHLAQSGRRVNVNDLWIAASAATHNLPVVTQDDDFTAIEGIGNLKVIRA